MVNEEKKIRKIAIIGSGIAGLALAACLKVIPTEIEEVVIFDPFDDVQTKNLGGAMSLSGGALVLQKLGYLRTLRYFGKAVNRIHYLTNKEEDVLEVDLSQIFPRLQELEIMENPLTYTMRWSALRQLLYDCAFKENGNLDSEGLPPCKTRIIYRPKRKFSSLAEDSVTGKVTLYFSNRLHEGEFDLVIGADGAKSVVRKFTALPNETILTSLPFGRYLPSAFGVQDTGLRVVQCISPPVSEKSEFQETASCESMTEEELVAAADHMSEGKIEHHLGNGCNAMTMRVGDFENTYYVLQVVYRETFHHSDDRDTQTNWEPTNGVRSEVEELLKKGGFLRYRELHAMLDIASRPGGLIYDVGIKDTLYPFRTWASHSGRVILIGDSCHAT